MCCPYVLLILTAQLAINILSRMEEGTRKMEHSGSIQVYTGLNTSPSVTAMQSAPSRFLATGLVLTVASN